MGQIDQTGSRILLSSGIGVFNGAPDQGMPTMCLGVHGYPFTAETASADCFGTRDVCVQPSLIGLEDDGLWVWTLLPGDAVTAILVDGGRPVMWQTPSSGVVAFYYPDGAIDSVTLRVLDGDGNEIATSDRATPAVTVDYGSFGDFSTTEAEDLDFTGVVPALAECLTAHGYAAESEGVDLTTLVGVNDSVGIAAAHEACWQGLGLPDLR